ncbi:corrinoid ABC transporter substrate-binding protein [Serratia fonticola]|uniref:Corrinoid ABC transporter substrate-binding protein n=1 Tax=Serratia fonticola TaxID=47917 RepID=A0A4U9VZY8_SERFO|nr:corrinoid ABC transporter substrate-binding protein [Serratia fonticola]
MGREAQADAMVKDVFQQRALVAKRLQDIPEDQRVRVYMANPDLTTYGSGKYTGLMMQHAGAVNVAAKDIQGFKQISIEDVLKWNPAVIFVQERYPDVVQQILTSPTVAADRGGETQTGLPDAGICQSLGLPNAGSTGAWGIVDGKNALPTAFHRC